MTTLRTLLREIEQHEIDTVFMPGIPDEAWTIEAYLARHVDPPSDPIRPPQRQLIVISEREYVSSYSLFPDPDLGETYWNEAERVGWRS